MPSSTMQTQKVVEISPPIADSSAQKLDSIQLQNESMSSFVMKKRSLKQMDKEQNYYSKMHNRTIPPQ